MYPQCRERRFERFASYIVEIDIDSVRSLPIQLVEYRTGFVIEGGIKPTFFPQKLEDGEIGQVEDFVIDDETWAIRYLIVDTQNWWPGKKVLISTRWIERISWEESKVFIDLTREAIKRGPEYTEETLITRDHETKLHRHYNRECYWVDELAGKSTVMHQTDLPTCVLRFPAVVGPKDHRRFQRWLQPMLRGDAELRIQDGWARWRWTHGFVEDVAEAVVLAVTNSASAGRIYNVGESHAPTMAERLAEFARVAGWRGHIFEVPASELGETDRMPYDFAHHIAYDTTRIRTELGYNEVVPHQFALARTLEYERAPEA